MNFWRGWPWFFGCFVIIHALNKVCVNSKQIKAKMNNLFLIPCLKINSDQSELTSKPSANQKSPCLRWRWDLKITTCQLQDFCKKTESRINYGFQSKICSLCRGNICLLFLLWYFTRANVSFQSNSCIFMSFPTKEFSQFFSPNWRCQQSRNK